MLASGETSLRVRPALTVERAELTRASPHSRGFSPHSADGRQMRTLTSLRADFATRMAAAYGREVPAYDLLVEVCEEVNVDVLGRDGDAAERFGSVSRVTAERHGAIRVGTPAELRQVSRIFAALGMYPVGFYDLREAARSSVPVVSTAFRPVDPDELAANPFRMFTSLLVTDDRRFFSAQLQSRLDAFLAARTLFPAELLELAEQAIDGAGLPGDDADRFLKLATEAFALSDEPVDAAWYAELEAVSAVAADIGGVTSTHINHLTPRVLDIDELYRRMTARGVEMIDTIQGPPRVDGTAVLLRQTSFRALAEQRLFRTASGDCRPGQPARPLWRSRGSRHRPHRGRPGPLRRRRGAADDGARTAP